MSYTLSMTKSNKELEAFLESIGLNEEDQKVYTTLLALADAPAALIAKKSDVKRTSAYQILEKIKRLGLASSYRSNGKLRFFAESPNKIRQIIEDKLNIFNRVLPSLQNIREVSRFVPHARVAEGHKGIKNLFLEALEDNKEKVVYTLGSSLKLKEAVGGDVIYTETRIKLGIRSRALRVPGEEWDKNYAKDQGKYLREVRWLPDSVSIPGLFIFWDNKCGFISTKGEGYALLVESKDFSESLKSFFNFLWGISQKSER